MDGKIRTALISLLNEEVIVASWGLTDLTIKDTSFEFFVSGFIYQGKVTVAVQESDCLISLDNGNTFKCAINNLVQSIDCMIEKTSEYDTKIIEWIKHYKSASVQK